MNMMKYEKKICTILMITACVAFCFGFVKSIHNPDKVKIEIVQCESQSDDYKYYVLMEYKITNLSNVTLTHVQLETMVYDIDGELLGTITSTFGSYNNNFRIKNGDSKVFDTSLEALVKSDSISDVFIELYNNGINDLSFEHEIQVATWVDNYKFTK